MDPRSGLCGFIQSREWIRSRAFWAARWSNAYRPVVSLWSKVHEKIESGSHRTGSLIYATAQAVPSCPDVSRPPRGGDAQWAPSLTRIPDNLLNFRSTKGSTYHTEISHAPSQGVIVATCITLWSHTYFLSQTLLVRPPPTSRITWRQVGIRR